MGHKLNGVTPDRLNAAATEVALAEYAFVTGLISFYRRVELTVLAGTGLVLSGVVAALAAFEAAKTPKGSAEAILLTVGAWAPAFLLLIENMALTRLRRASLYVACDLRPLANKLAGRHDLDLLCWELAPSRRLLEKLQSPKLRRPVQVFASSMSLVLTIACTSVVFTIAGLCIDFTVLNLAVGGIASLCSVALAVYGFIFTWQHEQREG